MHFNKELQTLTYSTDQIKSHPGSSYVNNDETTQAILNVLAAIPRGRVCTYGTIAALAGRPGSARQVGFILKSLPADSVLPWHRVINAQGRISFPQHSEKHALQKSLIEAEGVPFLNQKVNLRTFLWHG